MPQLGLEAKALQGNRSLKRSGARRADVLIGSDSREAPLANPQTAKYDFERAGCVEQRVPDLKKFGVARPAHWH